MKNKWLHRITLGLGWVAFAGAVLVPAAAPVLGPVGVKLVAIGAMAAATAGTLSHALGKAPPELFPPGAEDVKK